MITMEDFDRVDMRAGTSALSPDELLFFSDKPALLDVYLQLRGRITGAHADVSVRAARTQLSFRSRYIFAMASFQRAPKTTGEYLLVSFGLGYEKRSPRIAAAVEAAKNRWTHHVPVRSVEEIDGELLEWIEEAYRFSNVK